MINLHRTPWFLVVVSACIVGGAGAVMAACSSSDDGGPAAETDSGADTATSGDTLTSDTATSGDAPDTRDGAVADTSDAGCKPVDAGPIDDAAVGRGLAIVTANKCTGCHTADLSGSTTPIKGAYPKNLTPDLTGLACESDDAIIKAVTTGIDDDGSVFCVMPKFTTIDAAGLKDLIAYLRSLPPVKKEIPATVCPPDDGGTDAADGG